MLLVRLADMLIQVSIIGYFIYRHSLTVDIVLIASITCNTISLLVFIFSYSKLITYQNDIFIIFSSVFSDILKYSLPLIIWGVFIWAQNMMGRWYLDIFLAKSDVANFSVMTSLALIPGATIVALIGQFFAPIAYSKENDNPGYISLMNKKIFIFSIL